MNMGQVIINNQKPKYANLVAIKTGTRADDILDENEIWLIDSTNATKINGKGKYDKYIVGDGQTAAKNLPLHDIDPNVPTSLSQLSEDANHRTVTDEDKQRWNSGTGGGGTPIESSEDITVINDAQQNINRLEFANKQYNNLTHSGLGKVYVKKDIQTVQTSETEKSFSTLDADSIIAGVYGTAYNNAYDIRYNAEYKSIIETAATSQSSEFIPNATAREAANTAYTSAYNQAISDSLSQEEATNLGNAAYKTAYQNGISSSSSDKANAKTYVETPSKNIATPVAKTAAETVSMNAVNGVFPSISWTKKKYADGRFITQDNKLYMNLTLGGRNSVTCVSFDVEEGEIYKIVARKSDVAGEAWTSRLWTITARPQQGDTRVEVFQAYKINNENLLNSIVNEADFVEVKQDGRMWINYISYPGDVGICEIERIYKTENTIEVNQLPVFDKPNTEYIIQYEYDLVGGVLDLPENSVLKFDGGCIKNGYIRGNNSSISAFSSDVILPNINLVGAWKNKEYYAKWFGAAGDGITDDSDILQGMLNLAENIGSNVTVDWTGGTYKTTKSLLIKSNTTIRGGKIVAYFENPLDWIIQTNALYSNGNIMNGISKLPNYTYIASWQEFDGNDNQSLLHINNCFIEGLSIEGTLIKRMIVPDENLNQGTAPTTFSPTNYSKGDYWIVGIAGTYCNKQCAVGDVIYCSNNYDTEYSAKDFTISSFVDGKIWDGSWLPIYGGIRLNGASCPTNNVSIRGTAIGIARGACLHGYDIHLSVSARFVAYAARAINTTTVANCYLNAWCNYYDPTNQSTYTPYYLEYQGFNAMPHLTSNIESYIEGNGGIDHSDLEHDMPKLCSVKLNYASILFANTITDSGAEVGFAATNSTVILDYPYFEGVNFCYLYMALTRCTVNTPECISRTVNNVPIGAEYDFIGHSCSFVLNNCSGRIEGKGGSTGVDHKYILATSGDLVSVLGNKSDNAPEDSRFVYLSAGGSGEMNIVSATGSTLEPLVGKYYKFTSVVNTLAITLPAMTNVTSAKAICIDFTVGDNPNITFTSADSKPISYYENYGYSSINSEYEISCLFNGTKWIIANTVID